MNSQYHVAAQRKPQPGLLEEFLAVETGGFGFPHYAEYEAYTAQESTNPNPEKTRIDHG